MKYAYAMKYRPPGIGTVPEGDFKVRRHPNYPHGMVEYPRQLTSSEVYKFELVPIITMHEMAVLVIREMGEWAKSYKNTRPLMDYIIHQFNMDLGYPSETMEAKEAMQALHDEVYRQLMALP